jgi:Domain of unknown function (DUF1707)
MHLSGDADRDQAAAALREHFARGRLTLDELSERIEIVFRSRSREDLRLAFRGLPESTARGLAATAARAAAVVLFTGAWLLFSFALLTVLALTAIIHGVSGLELAGFALVWFVPTYFLARLWRRPSPRHLPWGA